MGARPRDGVVAVVDDDPGMLRALARLLNAHGFATAEFRSAEALLAQGRIYAFHCLVIDIHLSGMSGLNLKRRLEASGWRIPTIFITASDDKSSMSEAMETGCVAFLRKPFVSNLLIDAINGLPYQDEAAADND
jgi:FixJ family two-component response regulator